jgi:hypothetical protein
VGGLTRTDLHGIIGLHTRSQAIARALELLLNLKLAYPKKAATAGRWSVGFSERAPRPQGEQPGSSPFFCFFARSLGRENLQFYGVRTLLLLFLRGP